MWKKGFTLIELLVVISIIALLMAILVPVLNLGKRHAKMVVCQSNLKQWGLIWSFYLNDNNYLFIEGLSGVESGGSNIWINALKPYYMAKQKELPGGAGRIRLCPMATKIASEVTGYWVSGDPHIAWGYLPGDHAHGERTYGSYGMNHWLCNLQKPREPVWPMKLHWRTSNVRDTAHIPVLSDAWWASFRPRAYDEPPPYPRGAFIESGVNNMRRVCIDRHGNHSLNFLFVDYTVRSVDLKDLWGEDMLWHRSWRSEIVAAGEPVWPQWLRH